MHVFTRRRRWSDSSPGSVKTSTGSTTAPAPVTDPLFGVGELQADWTGQYANAAGGRKGEVQEQKVEGSLVDATLWFRGTITHYPS
ncbi:MAG: hypothetical protein R2726_14055 [Acidimicrobiales bacterium]